MKVLQELSPFERGGGMAGKRESRWEEQWEVERIHGVAWETQHGGGRRVTTVWWANACAQAHRGPAWHSFVRQNYKWVALCQTWNVCVKEISETIVAIFLPFYFPEWDFEPHKQDYYSVKRGVGWQCPATPWSQEKTGFLPITVLIEITCHSLLPLIQGSIFNWAIDLGYSFLYKIISTGKTWRLRVLEPYLKHIF